MSDETPAPIPEEKPDVKAAKPPKHRFVFVKWARRRRRMVTFIGALIVFGTFVVNDAFREHLKDVVDSVDRAEDSYFVRAEVHDISDRLHKMELTLGRAPNAAVIRKNFVQDRWDRSRQRGVGFDNLKRLLFKLNIESLISSLDNDVTPKYNRLDKILHWSDYWLESEDGAWLLRQTEDKVDSAILVLSFQVRGEARKVANQAEVHYRIATWASYFLYAVGWGLALLGRLIGVDTDLGE